MTVQKRLLSVALVLCATALTSWSVPSFYGETGLVQIPTAEITPTFDFDVALGYANTLAGDDEISIYPLRVNYGLAPQVEVSAFYADSLTGGGAAITGGGVKWRFLTEDVLDFQPGAALGVRTVRDINDVNQTDVYGVVTKTIFARGNWDEVGYAFRAHAGITYTTYSGALDADFYSPFLGLEYMNSNGTSVIVDALAEQKDGFVYRAQTISGALRQPISENFVLDLGSTRAFGDPNNSNTLYLSMNYHYGAER